MKNLVIRALTGAVYVALLIGCILYGPITSFLFFASVSAASIWEFSSLMNNHKGTDITRQINMLAAFLLNAAVWLQCAGSPTASKMYALYGFTLLYLLITELYRKADDPIQNWGLTFASQLYIAVPLALIHFLSVGVEGYTWMYILALFIFVWANDTGAYLCGSALHNVFPAKLFERISPKKSWVGSIGGGIITLGIAAGISFWDHSLTILQWLGFALTVVVFGTWGDLVESLLKRQLGIKDSGHVLPGHGGMLDRFDSVLLAVPAVVIYFILVVQK